MLFDGQSAAKCFDGVVGQPAFPDRRLPTSPKVEGAVAAAAPSRVEHRAGDVAKAMRRSDSSYYGAVAQQCPTLRVETDYFVNSRPT